MKTHFSLNALMLALVLTPLPLLACDDKDVNAIGLQALVQMDGNNKRVAGDSDSDAEGSC